MKRPDNALPYKCSVTMYYEVQGENYKEARNNLLSIIESDTNKINHGYALSKVWDVKIIKKID